MVAQRAALLERLIGRRHRLCRGVQTGEGRHDQVVAEVVQLVGGEEGGFPASILFATRTAPGPGPATASGSPDGSGGSTKVALGADPTALAARSDAFVVANAA